MADETTHLKLPYILANQAQKHVTHNEAIRLLDALVQMSVISRTLTAPPGSPSDGDRYIVAAGATGAWAGWDWNIAYYVDGGWTRLVPNPGWTAWVDTEALLFTWDGSAWTAWNVSPSFRDDLFTLLDDTDPTKKAQFQLSGISTGVTRSYTLPNVNGALASLGNLAQTFAGAITFSNTFIASAATASLGTSTAASTVNVGTGATTSGNTKTINIGTAGVSGSTTNINLGSAVGGALGTLTVRSPNVTFDSVSGSLLATLNKSVAGNDVGFSFQTAFSAKALIGLLGNDDFTFKVTPDASNYYASIRTHAGLHGRTSLKPSEREYPITWLPRAGSATFDAVGLATASTGTASAVAPSSSNLFTQAPRNKIASAATAGSSATLRGSQLCLWRGNAAGLGGFYLCMRGGIETFQSNARMFMGLYSAAADIGNVNPSTLLNMAGIGFDSGQTTLRLFRNDGSGAATAIDLGASFPTNSSETLYELILSAEPNASEIRYRVENLNSGAVAEGALSSDLPASTQFLTPHFWFNNGTTAAAVEIAVVSLYAEPASLHGSRGSIA